VVTLVGSRTKRDPKRMFSVFPGLSVALGVSNCNLTN